MISRLEKIYTRILIYLRVFRIFQNNVEVQQNNILGINLNFFCQESSSVSNHFRLFPGVSTRNLAFILSSEDILK